MNVADATLSQTQLYSYPASAVGRNVVNPVGLATFERNGAQFAIVGDARVFDAAEAQAPQTFPVATFSVSGGQVTAIDLDVCVDADDDDSVAPNTTCWVVSTVDGSQAFTANTNHNSLSSFSISESGAASFASSLAFSLEGDFTDASLTDQAVVDVFCINWKPSQVT